MATTGCTSADWFTKLQLEIVDNEDGSANLIFEWDENDPGLSYWNSLTNEEREKFILDVLENAVNSANEVLKTK